MVNFINGSLNQSLNILFFQNTDTLKSCAMVLLWLSLEQFSLKNRSQTENIKYKYCKSILFIELLYQINIAFEMLMGE